MGDNISGIGGIGSGQDTYAPRSGQASGADIRQFEQEIEALLQELQAKNGSGGSPGADLPNGGFGGSGAPGGGAASPTSAIGGPGGQAPNTNQVLEQVAQALLQALESRDGTQAPGSVGGGAGGGATGGGTPSLAAAGAAPNAAPTGQASGAQASGGTTQPVSASIDGGTTSVDGAKPGGDTVAMQVVNNTGKDEKVVLTNSQNQTFAEADLKPGEKQTFLLDPNDPNTKSARMQTTAPDGSLRQDAKLTEFNLQPGHTAINVSNNNFAGITGTDGHAVDSEQMQINDNQGKVVGDGAANGAYQNSVDDANAMIMGDDPSRNYTVSIS